MKLLLSENVDGASHEKNKYFEREKEREGERKEGRKVGRKGVRACTSCGI